MGGEWRWLDVYLASWKEHLAVFSRGQSRAAADLSERGVKGLLPPEVVNRPENLRFVPVGETCGPNFAVAFVLCDVQTVNDGHAASEFTVRFDIDKMLRLRSHDRRI